MTHYLTIPMWHPARLNQLLGNRHVAAALKRQDRNIVATYGRQIPKADGKRRVRLKIVLGPRQRAGDTDAYFKSLLDALTHAGLIVDDNRQSIELMPVEFGRDKERRTEIQLTDL